MTNLTPQQLTEISNGLKTVADSLRKIAKMVDNSNGANNGMSANFGKADELQYLIQDLISKAEKQTLFGGDSQKKDYVVLAYRCPYRGIDDVLMVRDGDLFRAHGIFIEHGANVPKVSENEIIGCGKSTISSVKRLSDGEVFAVGDKIAWDWNSFDGSFLTINGFALKDGNLYFLTNEGSGMYNFDNINTSNLRKVKDIVARTPLFTTDDGKEVFSKDTFPVFKVDEDYQVFMFSACDCEPDNHPKSKYFSTKELAEEYVLMNKRCFSVKDIFTTWNLNQEEKEKIIQLAKPRP